MSDLNVNIFIARRAEAAKRMEDDSILVLSSSKLSLRNNDTTFPFRQDSNFYYLTGFQEPESVLIVHSDGRSILFCREKNPELEKWDGFMWGPKAAKEKFGFDEAYDINQIDEILPNLIRGHKTFNSLVGKSSEFDLKVTGWINKANKMERHQGNIDLKNFSNQLGSMRLIKDDAEISIIRKSCEIAAISHRSVMQQAKVGMSEYDLEAMYMNEFKANGSREPSYTPIIAGGARACILHYIDNDQDINDGDLVLVDAGCEFGMYASDITRTYPINGKFSGEQRAIYDVVLEAHDAACHAAKVGNPCTDPQKISEKSLSQGLKDIGLLSGSLDEILENKLFREFYYHKIGHWMGLDVHDDCPYSVDGKELLFKENMVMTIEPGVYVNDSAEVDERWKGIGVRIENDILINSDGYENLTAKVPVLAEDIEQLMSK